MIKHVLNLDHNQNFASERAHLRRKIGGTKRWGMLSAYRGCCSALLSFNHSIHKRSQVFHKTLPSGEEANLPVVTTVSLRAKMSCLFYTPKKKTKKNRKHGTQPGLHRSAKSCSLTHFCEFHMKFRGGTFKNSTKLYPFKYVWISRASYILNTVQTLLQICMFLRVDGRPDGRYPSFGTAPEVILQLSQWIHQSLAGVRQGWWINQEGANG